MAILVRFTPTGGSDRTKYDEAIKKLEQAGAGSPAGRLYHVAFGDKDNLRVSEVWDTKESFEKFGQTLRPILAELGIDPGQPEIVEVFNIIEGTKAASTST